MSRIHGTFARVAGAALVSSLLVAMPASPGGAADARFNAGLWDDDLDTRWQAHVMSAAASQVGYEAFEDLDGRTSDGSFKDGRGSAVFGMFTHASSGLMKTQWQSGQPDQWIYSGCPDCTHPSMRMLSEYRPLLDVDDVRLAIFAGCYTSLVPSWGYSLPEVAAARGMDSTIAFPGLVYSPVSTSERPMSETRYSGNYFWERAATYLKNGAAVADAMKWATSDLLAKEGDAGGWDEYQIDGSIASPGQMTLTPERGGRLGTSDLLWDANLATDEDWVDWAVAFAEDRVDFANALIDILLENTPTAAGLVAGPGGSEYLVVGTAEQVTYRFDENGRLVDLSSSPTAQGDPTYSVAEAAEIATQFAMEHAAGFDQTWPRSDRVLHHIEGENLARFTWRPRTHGIPVGRTVLIEVDLRTGDIGHYIDAQARSSSAPAALEGVVTEGQAIKTAREAAGAGGELVSADLEHWVQTRWLVTLDYTEPTVVDVPASGGGTVQEKVEIPRFVQVEIDALTGDVQALSGT